VNCSTELSQYNTTLYNHHTIMSHYHVTIMYYTASLHPITFSSSVILQSAAGKKSCNTWEEIGNFFVYLRYVMRSERLIYATVPTFKKTATARVSSRFASQTGTLFCDVIWSHAYQIISKGMTRSRVENIDTETLLVL
jgi:hypothetical protein